MTSKNGGDGRKRGGSDGGKNRETEKMGFADKKKRRLWSHKKVRHRKQFAESGGPRPGRIKN
jgi:hypothetical protein